MSIHIVANKGDIAETVLLCGDPLRAKHIAENYFKDAKCYNQVRGMLGYTGTYQGKRLSIQSVGMGMPSMRIYAHELIVGHDIKTLIRIGTGGALHESVKLRDIVVATSASTDSNMNRLVFGGKDFAPAASFELLVRVAAAAERQQRSIKMGNILTTDNFYDKPEDWQVFVEHGTLAIEMEISALYTIAAKYGVKALAMVTISDHLISREHLSAEERQQGFNKMVELGLEVACGQ